MKRRTLVVHTGGIGDFLLMCPVLRGLAASGPVDVAGRLERVRLAVAGGLATSAYDLDAVEFDTLFHGPSARLRKFLGQYDRAVVWMRDDDGMIVGRMRESGVADASAFPGLPPANWTRHASEYYHERLGLAVRAPLVLGIAPGAERFEVVIHCGSGGRAKNWPLERFVELGSLLAADCCVTWLLGPAEEHVVLPGRADVRRPSSVSAAAELLASSSLYVGNDSGITHLAAAVGCPTVAIFGPTDPRVWAPQGAHVRVIGRAPWPEPGQVYGLALGLREARREV